MSNFTYNDELYHWGVKGMKWSPEAKSRHHKRTSREKEADEEAQKKADTVQDRYEQSSWSPNDGDFNQIHRKHRKYRNISLAQNPTLRNKKLTTDYSVGILGFYGKKADADQVNKERLYRRREKNDAVKRAKKKAAAKEKEKKLLKKHKIDSYKRGAAYSRIRGKKKPGRRMFTVN